MTAFASFLHILDTGLLSYTWFIISPPGLQLVFRTTAAFDVDEANEPALPSADRASACSTRKGSLQAPHLKGFCVLLLKVL